MVWTKNIRELTKNYDEAPLLKVTLTIKSQ